MLTRQVAGSGGKRRLTGAGHPREPQVQGGQGRPGSRCQWEQKVLPSEELLAFLPGPETTRPFPERIRTPRGREAAGPPHRTTPPLLLEGTDLERWPTGESQLVRSVQAPGGRLPGLG